MKPLTNLQTVKLFAKVNGRDVLPEIKLPRTKGRGKDLGPRDLKEKKLREDLLKELRKLKFSGQIDFWRIENSLPAYHSLPDFFIISLRKQCAWFVELKAIGGVIKKGQSKFAASCKLVGLNHIFAYSVEQVLELI